MMTGQVVGNYKIVEKLGEGGMGAVFKAVDVMVERTVAVKMLRPEIARQPEVLERFRAEAVTLARLNHPNIATLYSFFRHGDEYFMVMEFVPGRTLDALLREWGPMPAGSAVSVFAPILDGIQHAHALGILHRDIKPANVMLTETGAVKVTDFGIARVLGQSRMTRQGNIVGTIEYIAPERVRGQEADPRSDIYSLGAMLYEMLSGRLPFERDNEFALMQAHLNDPPRPLSALGITAPAGIERVVMRSLAKRPEDRFQTAAEFRAALDAAWAEAASQPQPRVTRLAAPTAKETRLAAPGTDPGRPPAAPPTALASAAPAPPAVRRLPCFGWKIYAAAALLLVVSLGLAAIFGGLFSPRPAGPEAAAPGGLEIPKDSAATPAQKVLQNSIPVPEPEPPAAEPEAPPAAAPRREPRTRPEQAQPSAEERRRAALKALEAGGGSNAQTEAGAEAREKERRRLEALKALEK